MTAEPNRHPEPAQRTLFQSVRKLLHNTFRMSLVGASRLLYPRKTPDWVDLTKINLTLPRLASEFDGYCLVQISDFHFGTWLERNHLAEAIELVNQLHPDLIAITGDFVTYGAERYSGDLIVELGKLRARDGVVAVLGNHDHWSDPDEVRWVLAQAGIRELNNLFFTLRRGAASLHVCGVDDYMAEQDHLEQVLEKLPPDGAAILLAHEPDFADVSSSSRRFDLQLSGHSHGGQVILPWLGAPVLPRFGRKYSSGLYQVNGMFLYTNRGLGTAELQVRINCRPEITVLTLQSVKSITENDS